MTEQLTEMEIDHETMARGVRGSRHSCPVALKIAEAHPGTIVETRPRGTDVRPQVRHVNPWARDGSNRVHHYAHSPALEQWIAEYDHGLEPNPVTLQLSEGHAGITGRPGT